MEELDQFQEIQEGSGMIAQTISFAHIPLLLSRKSESRFGRKLAPTSKVDLTFILNLMFVVLHVEILELHWHPEKSDS